MLEHEDLSKVRLLVLANKQDVKGCMTAAEISQQLQLTEMKNHTWNIQVNISRSLQRICIEHNNDNCKVTFSTHF